MEASLGLVTSWGETYEEYLVRLPSFEGLLRGGVHVLNPWQLKAFSQGPFREERGPLVIQMQGICDASCDGPWVMYRSSAVISPFAGREDADKLEIILHKSQNPGPVLDESGDTTQSYFHFQLDKRHSEMLVPLNISREDPALIERGDECKEPLALWDKGTRKDVLAREGVVSSYDILEFNVHRDGLAKTLLMASIGDIVSFNYESVVLAQQQWDLLPKSSANISDYRMPYLDN